MDLNTLCENIKELYKDNPYIRVYVENNSIVLEQDFTDNILVSFRGFDAEKQTFKHIITFEGNEFITLDKKTTKGAVGDIKDKKISANLGSHTGQFYTQGIVMGFGRDNTTGEIGPVLQKWNSNHLKIPVKEYLESLGMTRKKSMGFNDKSSKTLLFIILGVVVFVTAIVGVGVFVLSQMV